MTQASNMLLSYGRRVESMLNIRYSYQAMARLDAVNTARPKIRVAKNHPLYKCKSTKSSQILVLLINYLSVLNGAV